MNQVGNQTSRRDMILERIAAMDSLPSPSPLVLKLMEMASDERSSAGQLARVVEQDPGFTTRVIRLVNSAFYGPRLKVSSISQAIVMIGFNRLRMLALSVSLRDTFPMGKVEGMDYEFFWKTSLYRGLLAQGLAASIPRTETPGEEIFTIGLILEIGIPLLFHVCPKELKPAFPGGVVSLRDALDWERTHLGIDHREVGHFLLTRWHFPEGVIEQQRHYGAEAMGGDRPLTCRIVEYARVAAQILFGARSDFGFLIESAASLGLDPALVEGILSSCFSRVETAAQQLRLKVDTAQDMLEVMEKANRALAGITRSVEENLGQISACPAPEPAGQDRLLDAVAHEIRNPLMAIGGFARRIAQSAGEQTELSRYAGIIVQESRRLEKVMNGFAALSKPYVPNKKPADLVKILHGQVERMGSMTKDHPPVIFSDNGEESVIMPVDAQEMGVAFGRLFQTLLQSVRGPQGLIKVHVRVSEAPGQAEVGFELAGGSLTPGVRDMIAREATPIAPMEMDFDLLLARKVVEAHGGHVWAESEPGKGSRFAFTIPA